jgi:hypothetical protein
VISYPAGVGPYIWSKNKQQVENHANVILSNLAAFFYAKCLSYILSRFHWQLLTVPIKTHAAQNGNLGYGNKDRIWLGKLGKS